jgi:NAD(P)-dependent dehydrogenase (short-subunit alcohol dehydrogenase family)
MDTTDVTTGPDRRVALITGANRGLGRSMAEHLAAAGWGIVGTYRSHPEEADEVARAVAQRGVPVAMLRLDTGRAETFALFAGELAGTLRETFGRDRLDALVNNAGIGLNRSFAETTEEQFDELFRVQVRGPFFLTQRLLPLLADGGSVLNVSSGLTRNAFPERAAYAATKGAIDVLTLHQARELGARGIRVNALAPGATATDFGGGTIRDNPAVQDAVRSTVALGRVGQPDDIGGVAAAILSDGFGWVTGQRIEASGGQHL